MTVLDCETAASALASLEAILGMPQSRIEQILRDFDTDQFLADNPDAYEVDGIEGVEDIVLSRLLTQSPYRKHELHVDRICWFHFTRVTAPAVFAQGIQPLGNCLESIWLFLGELAVAQGINPQQWREFRRTFGSGSGHSAHLYYTKSQDKRHWGPYAMLVRDAAFWSDEMMNHDYLDVPEIVEDICITCEEATGVDLLPAYKAATKPCIVKFISDAPSRRIVRIVANTARYLNVHLRDEALHLSCSTCFDGEGATVAPENILSTTVVTDEMWTESDERRKRIPPLVFPEEEAILLLPDNGTGSYKTPLGNIYDLV